ncbi:hypothetical protein [Paenibacillus luteus]|uniref:hypothetical protein n=1 Tax=Paenibacillus luteus TaxID=2545753 RepID=UPI001F4FA6C5|nr:hypothetical protein [Paenibacillus luteus]
MYDGLKMFSYTSIYEFCGNKPEGYIFFGSALQIDEDARKRILEEVKDKAINLFE